MMRLLNVGLGVVGAALLVLVGGVTAAQAAASDCPRGYFCAWTGPNYTGTMAIYETGDPNLGDAYGPQGMNDNIESFFNNTGSLWGLWRQVGGEQGWAVSGGIRHATLDGSWNNNISAIRRLN